eukprot:scaffold203339_cov43-Prasinocladus_malaysianus.AAC.1
MPSPGGDCAVPVTGITLQTHCAGLQVSRPDERAAQARGLRGPFRLAAASRSGRGAVAAVNCGRHGACSHVKQSQFGPKPDRERIAGGFGLPARAARETEHTRQGFTHFVDCPLHITVPLDFFGRITNIHAAIKDCVYPLLTRASGRCSGYGTSTRT